MDLIVLLKVRREEKKKNPLPARRCFQHPAITLCKSWPGMLIHCYLKCIEFPWKMIHSCRLQLINNNDEPSWHLEYLHAYLALPCMWEHSRVCCAPQPWQHIWKTDGFELKRTSKWVISATGTGSSSLAWCFAVSAHGNLWWCRQCAGCWGSLSPLILTRILTWTQCTVPCICSAQCFEEFKGITNFCRAISD